MMATTASAAAADALWADAPIKLTATAAAPPNKSREDFVWIVRCVKVCVLGKCE